MKDENEIISLNEPVVAFDKLHEDAIEKVAGGVQCADFCPLDCCPEYGVLPKL